MQRTEEARRRVDDEIDFAAMFLRLWEKRVPIVLATLVAAAAGLTVALLLPVSYRAEALLSPVSAEAGGGLSALSNQLGGLAALAGVNIGGASGGKQSEAIATLSSRKLIEDFIVRNDLLPVLYSKRWDAQNQRWLSGEEQPTAWMGVEKFRTEVWSVAQDKKTGLVTVAIEWRDPRQAADWVNRLVDDVNATLRRESIDNSNRNLAYLNGQLEKSSVVELRQAIFRLIEAEVKNVMLAEGSQQYAFKIVDKAVPPERKIKPKRAQIVVLSTFAGFVLACIGVLLFVRDEMRQAN